MQKKIIIILVIALAIIGAGAFYSGMSYEKSQAPKFGFPGGANFQAMKTNRTGATGANFISGNVISKDDVSITLQIPNNGGSKIIFYSDATQISKMASGTVADLVTDTSVSVTGTTNSDGSVTAQSIQIRPARPVQ